MVVIRQVLRASSMSFQGICVRCLRDVIAPRRPVSQNGTIGFFAVLTPWLSVRSCLECQPVALHIICGSSQLRSGFLYLLPAFLGA